MDRSVGRRRCGRRVGECHQALRAGLRVHGRFATAVEIHEFALVFGTKPRRIVGVIEVAQGVEDDALVEHGGFEREFRVAACADRSTHAAAWPGVPERIDERMGFRRLEQAGGQYPGKTGAATPAEPIVRRPERIERPDRNGAGYRCGEGDLLCHEPIDSNPFHKSLIVQSRRECRTSGLHDVG